MFLSAANGILFPISMVFFGSIINAFLNPLQDMLADVRQQAVIYSILGSISLVLGFFQAYLLVLVAENNIKRIRLLFFKVGAK